MLIYILMLLTAVFNTMAQLLLKQSSVLGGLNWYLGGGLGLYGLSTVVYLGVLQRANLSLAYPFVVGLTLVLTVLGSSWILRESLALGQWFGLALLLGGLVVLGSYVK